MIDSKNQALKYMLTFRKTELLVASEIKQETGKIVKNLYFTDDGVERFDHKHDEERGTYTCGYCHKPLKRQDILKRHLAGCTARAVIDTMIRTDMKEYEVKQDDNRLELMMPYNEERGLRMYISGPPRCGKSHLIGQIIREYTLHFPEEDIFILSSR